LRKSLNEQRLKDQLAAKEAKIRSGKTTDEVKIPASRLPPATVVPEKKKATTASKPAASRLGFKTLSRSQYDQLSYKDKGEYNATRERIAAEKTAALTNPTVARSEKPTVARSEKPKSATVKPKSVRTEIADGNPVEATSQKEKDADFAARSSKTVRTPVKGDASTVKAPSGANRLSDDDN
jgi:hypothetical protein